MSWERFEIAVERKDGETRAQIEARVDRALWNGHLTTHVQLPVPEHDQIVDLDEVGEAS